MPDRRGKPCRMMWVWAIGGGTLGLLSGLIGREAILACTEAVERTVHRHLDDQIVWAAGRDDELRQTIQAIQVEEIRHLDYATQNRRQHGLAWFEWIIEQATETLIWLSTRGDSARLSRQLALSRPV